MISHVFVPFAIRLIAGGWIMRTNHCPRQLQIFVGSQGMSALNSPSLVRTFSNAWRACADVVRELALLLPRCTAAPRAELDLESEPFLDLAACFGRVAKSSRCFRTTCAGSKVDARVDGTSAHGRTTGCGAPEELEIVLDEF